MKTFVWDQRFVTGIESVDTQHYKLVELVNELGEILLGQEQQTPGGLQALFKQLADYANSHFSHEEQLMAEHGLDPRHVKTHRGDHAGFVEQVVSMWRSRESMERPAETLHGFLTAWLTFHILGEDRAMARQIALIKTGKSPATAYDEETRPVDNSTSALLAALHNLYGVLSMQNRDLAKANTRLEEKVAERTRSLAEANVKLQREQEELCELMEKIEQAQKQLLQSEKMAAIGQLAAGVAHEINNPIGFVNSNLGSLKGYVDQLLKLIDAHEAGTITEQMRKEADLEFLRQDLMDLVKESQDGLDRVKKIVSNLKDFSHVDESEWQEADLNAGLESTLNVVWNEIKYKATVEREYGTLPSVRCIPAQINQVFMNMLMNAAQAIEGQGNITLRSGVENNWVWLEVADTGKGMTPEVQKRIFEPFYTTKPVGKGTGLGLALSYDIVTKHGGRFDVKSEPGKGTAFRIYLPVGGPDTKAVNDADFSPAEDVDALQGS